MWQAQKVATNGINVHMYRGGVSGAPSVILLHGITDNGLCWERFATVLAETYDVIMLDVRGHGQSDKPETGYSYPEFAADVVGVIDALDLDRPVLIGHSMGAALAATVGVTYPTKVRALVLEDPPWREEPWTEEGAAETFEQFNTWMASCKALSLADLEAQARAETPHWPELAFHAWAESKHEFSPAVYEIVKRKWPMTPDEITAALTCPVLLVVGDEEQGAIVQESFAEKVRKLPGFQVAHIAGAGHSIRRDQPAAYDAALLPYLEQVLAS